MRHRTTKSKKNEKHEGTTMAIRHGGCIVC